MPKPLYAKIWLILASLGFYWVGDRLHFPLFVATIAVNYLLGFLFHNPSVISRRSRGLGLFLIGVCWNLGFLGYFKYWGFLVSVFYPGSAGTGEMISKALPMGISFYTFTQLMFLIDSYSGLIESPYRFLDYVLFAAFFPYTLSGPIVKHESIIPQIENGVKPTNLSMILFGGTLFAVGLFKKTVLADNLSQLADPVFDMARLGLPLSPLSAWVGALAFTLQLYFDFSGYSDMAVGLGKLFGINLPYNFNSPYKAVNVIDFWQRWHMTLTHFLTNYIYNPIELYLARRRILKGKSTVRPGKVDVPAFLVLVAVPTLVTMLAAGIWHRIGWTFICFGLLHGIYITFNHASHILRRKGYLPRDWPRPVNCFLTFLAVVVSFIFFRAADLSSVNIFLQGLVNWHGPFTLAIPGPTKISALLGLLLCSVWFLPNSQELCSMAASESPPKAN
jgi:alginate O-acetyltransferase complex protein AlgI